ncbi:MAG: hypothetical protein Q9M25_06240 [Mariprofundaceae bacterium]|nr:hypothetical protein [Mariprofundaceae bacterium]
MLAANVSPFFSVSCGAAEADARFKVSLSDTALQQGGPDVRTLLNNALPVLWDRLVPTVQRSMADAIAADSRMVARIVPGNEQTLVEFNGDRVFAALRKAHIAAIVSEPRFHVLLSVRNDIDQEMQQTRMLLEEQLAELRLPYGIVFSDSGAGLVLQWRWLDISHVELSVRGQSRLGEFSEVREITGADPLPALQQWLQQVLLKARDAYASDVDLQDNGMLAQTIDGFSIELIVARDSRLLEQVALEESLSHDVRVRSVLPIGLSRSERRYRVQIEAGDTRWLGEWFSRRGYALSRQADGTWLAR